MRIQLLGTAAAEGWPAPFCLCAHCEEARRRGGVNIRTRSGALVDDDLKIDFSPDTLMQMQRYGRNLAHLRTLLFTHQHCDHLAAAELEWAAKPFTQTPPPPFEIWGNAQVIAEIQRVGAPLVPGRHNFKLNTFAAGDHFTTAAGEEVWAMRADHVEGATILRIRRNGKTILYGHDSGLYLPEALDRLSDGIPLDLAIFDCTNGALQTTNRNHMGIDGVIPMRDELRRRGAIGPGTRCIATHFSHNGGALHEELVRSFMPHGIEVAFDGMMAEV